MGDAVTLRWEGRVAVVELARPEARNTFIPAVRSELCSILAGLENKPDVEGVILTCLGPDFSAGGDINSFVGVDPAAMEQQLALGHDCVGRITRLGFPVIAAVRGVVVGGAVGLVLACDLIVAEPRSKFHFPFLRLGLVPDWGLGWLLPRKIGRTEASRLLLRPSSIDCVAAERIGLVDAIADEGRAADEALALVRDLASYPRGAWKLTKQMLAGSFSSLDQALKFEMRAQAECVGSPEFKVRVDAFLGKSKSRARSSAPETGKIL